MLPEEGGAWETGRRRQKKAQQGSSSPHSAAERMQAFPALSVLCPPHGDHISTQLSPPSDSGFGCPPAHTQDWVQCPVTGRAVGRVQEGGLLQHPHCLGLWCTKKGPGREGLCTFLAVSPCATSGM